MEMRLRANDAQGFDTVLLKGDSDLYNAPKMKTAIINRIGTGMRKLRLDFEGVAYLDSTGVGAIIQILQAMKSVAVEVVFRVRLIVEDEGTGFLELDAWNEFLVKRQTALFNQDFDKFLQLASWKGKHSDSDDGGNSLVAALEYWNGGTVFNAARNKVGVVRWFTNGSA